MRFIYIPVLIFGLLLLNTVPVSAAATPGEVARIESATAVLQESLSNPEETIPTKLINAAYGIAVFPGFMKAGLGIGGSWGKGVLVVKTADGTWSDPSFVSMNGASLGIQAGAESTDVLLVFKTRESIRQIEDGVLTLGVTSAIAAGPIGRDSEASTDSQLKAEVYSYSRSRGLFAGVAVQGASLRMDYAANSSFYGVADPLRTPVAMVPDSARRLSCTIAGYTGVSSKVCA
jgi:lipid-binding SYLF domain-containing protein